MMIASKEDLCHLAPWQDKSGHIRFWAATWRLRSGCAKLLMKATSGICIPHAGVTIAEARYASHKIQVANVVEKWLGQPAKVCAII